MAIPDDNTGAALAVALAALNSIRSFAEFLGNGINETHNADLAAIAGRARDAINRVGAMVKP